MFFDDVFRITKNFVADFASGVFKIQPFDIGVVLDNRFVLGIRRFPVPCEFLDMVKRNVFGKFLKTLKSSKALGEDCTYLFESVVRTIESRY